MIRKIRNNFPTRQGPPSPIVSDLGKETVLDLVPFAGRM
jgi:hypothetical protein